MVWGVLELLAGIEGDHCPAHSCPAPNKGASLLFLLHFGVWRLGEKKALYKKKKSIETIEMMHEKSHFMAYNKGFLLLPKYYHKKTQVTFASIGKQDSDRKALALWVGRPVLHFHRIRILKRNRINRMGTFDLGLSLFCYYKELASVTMEAETSPELQVYLWRPRGAKGVVSARVGGRKEPVSRLKAVRREEIIFSSSFKNNFLVFFSITI